VNTQEFFDLYKNSTYDFPKIPDECDTVGKQAEWIIFHSGVPYVPLEIEGPWEFMLAEARGLDAEFVRHRGDGDGWSSLCVHGVGAYKTMSANSYPEYADMPDNQVPYDWTEIVNRCPVTVDYFKNKFPWKSYNRLRFMKLAPGGWIPPHNDGTHHRLVVVNISLNNPEGCDMVLENVGIVPFKNTGGAMAFNNCHNHIVQNLSNEPRYHMIVHGVWAPEYKQILVDSYRKLLDSSK
jgi:Aspartyl/Asparaginyl beta-hydroxylase